MSLSRRGFFNAAGGALAASSSTDRATPAQTGKGAFLIGRWMVHSADLHLADAKTAFVRGMQHESPQLKFPRGIPDRGDPVRVNITWDVCRERGANKHRPLCKMVLRIYPLDSLRSDAELHIVETPQGFFDAEEFRSLLPKALHAKNTDCHSRDWWIIKLNNDTKPLLQRAIDSCNADEPVLPPAVATPAWSNPDDARGPQGESE